MALAYNRPTFLGPFYRVHEGKVQVIRLVEHIALCNGTGRTAYLWKGDQYSVSHVTKHWFKLRSTAERKIASAERLENVGKKKKKRSSTKKGVRRKSV